MATFDYNPITGNLDLVGSGASYINGVVADPTALPVTVGTPPLDSVYLAKAGSGVWLINRKPAGLYCRVANNGNLNDWVALGAFPEINADGNWELYNSADPTKELKFDLSGISTGTTRTLTAPDASGTIARTEDFAAPPAIGSTTRNTGAFTTLSANNGTLTASAPVLDLSQTWNNASVTFSGLRLNITDTASAAASNLLEIQVGGVTRMMLKKSGTLHLGQFTNSGFYTPAPAWHGSTAGLLAATNLAIGSSLDTILERGGAGILEQRNLANAQTYRIYNTTDVGLTNYERGFMRWSSNVLQIGTEKGGTGSARALEFQTDGTSRWQITTAGILTTVSAPADSGGLTLQGGWIAYRAGTTNHWAIVNGDITQRATGNFQWSGQSDASNFSGDWLRLSRSAGGSLLLSAGTSTEHRLQFGGTTSSFPALKRSSTALQVRLADDSAYSVLDAQLRVQGTAPATSGATGTAGDIRYDADYIYICTAANTWKRAAIATW